MGDLTPDKVFPTGYFPSDYFGGSSGGVVVGALVGTSAGTSAVSGRLIDTNAVAITGRSGGSGSRYQLERIRKRYEEYTALKDAARFVVITETIYVPKVKLNPVATYTPTPISAAKILKRALLSEDYIPPPSRKQIKSEILRVYDEADTLKEALLNLYDEVA